MQSLSQHVNEALLTEGFIIKDDIVYFNPDEKGFVDTKFGKFATMKPFEGKLAFGRFLTAYQKEKEVDQSDYTEILKAIKGQSSKYQFDSHSRDLFIERTAVYLAAHLRKNNIDTILIMDSSSPLVNDLTTAINRRLPKYFETATFTKTISKNPNLDQIRIDAGDINLDQKTVDGLEKLLDKIRQSGKFSIKEVKFVPHRKFFKDWLVLQTPILSKIIDKNVALIDDYITSGETLSQASVILQDAGAKSVLGLAILKGK